MDIQQEEQKQTPKAPSMRFAFALYRYFPHGGLQCDMLRMAEEAVRRGHRVEIFTCQWTGPAPKAGITLHLLPVSGWSNHAKMASFGRKFLAELKKYAPYHAVVTFNRIPGGDLYFAADNCLAVEWRALHSPWKLKLLPRYRAFLKQEAAVCRAPECRIMIITSRQREQYQQAYQVPGERFVSLPPGMNPDCRRPADAAEKRRAVRAKLDLADEERMLILVGSNFRRKGGDRAIKAVAALPEELRKKCRLYLVGDCPAGGCDRLAKRLGIAGRVIFTGGRSDVPELLLGADLMIHPALQESAGSVLIEALAAGLPVIASGACGFSDYVAENDPALVLPEPFEQERLNRVLREALEHLPELARETVAYASRTDFCRRAEIAVNAMEETGRCKNFSAGI